MSLFSRRATLWAPLVLAACGFAPAFAPGGAAHQALSNITVKAPTTRDGFELVKRLEERMGTGADADYALDYTIKTETVNLGITASGDITRYNLIGSATWVLQQKGTKKTIAKGRAESFTGWSATGFAVAGLTAEADASARLMRILADQIVTDLIAGAETWAK